MTLPLTPEQTRPVVEALLRDGHAWLCVGHPARSFEFPTWDALARSLCETCEDWFHNGSPLGARHPDCRGTGKPIHTLSVPCNHSKMTYTDGTVCRCPGPVSVDAIVAEPLVPVVRTFGADDPLPVIWISPTDFPWLFFSHGVRRGITVIGNPQPGDWVAHLEAVT